jgi:hypothetical protein
VLKREFDYFERHSMKGPLMMKFYDALLSAQPTFTQPERNFLLTTPDIPPEITRGLKLSVFLSKIQLFVSMRVTFG